MLNFTYYLCWIEEVGEPRCTVASWKESSERPGEIEYERDADGNMIEWVNSWDGSENGEWWMVYTLSRSAEPWNSCLWIAKIGLTYIGTAGSFFRRVVKNILNLSAYGNGDGESTRKRKNSKISTITGI